MFTCLCKMPAACPRPRGCQPRTSPLGAFPDVGETLSPGCWNCRNLQFFTFGLIFALRHLHWGQTHSHKCRLSLDDAQGVCVIRFGLNPSGEEQLPETEDVSWSVSDAARRFAGPCSVRECIAPSLRQVWIRQLRSPWDVATFPRITGRRGDLTHFHDEHSA